MSSARPTIDSPRDLSDLRLEAASVQRRSGP
jgi:hypothetical protein